MCIQQQSKVKADDYIADLWHQGHRSIKDLTAEQKKYLAGLMLSGKANIELLEIISDALVNKGVAEATTNYLIKSDDYPDAKEIANEELLEVIGERITETLEERMEKLFQDHESDIFFDDTRNESDQKIERRVFDKQNLPTQHNTWR
jgi:hemoglobin-like flavoprotein